jgi:lipopolysaccharide/colanic/teichoic acid biosynthesis glycosyltransferase
MTGRVPELTLRQRFVKRTFDLTLALLVLALLGWVILLAWLAASIDTRSNGMFSQPRIGRWGRPFTIYKIKTMRPRPGIDTTVTTRQDARITPLGKWLRRMKVDELPQFFNVLRGDMSVVGPRPDVAGFADRLTGGDRALLSLRPGITGPATLAFRNEEELLVGVADPDAYNREAIYPAKVALNLRYLEDYSFRLDWRLVLATALGRGWEAAGKAPLPAGKDPLS